MYFDLQVITHSSLMSINYATDGTKIHNKNIPPEV